MSEPRSRASERDPASQGWQGVARAAARALGPEGQGDVVLMLRELLVFGLDGSAYALPVERVREIVRMRQLTTIPRSPDWLLGVITLRGEVVEVIDLRRTLGLGSEPSNRRSRIIVLHGDADRVTGVLVDSVSEVLRVPEDEIQPAQGLDMDCVTEICGRDGEFVSILDVERALELGDG